jgi:asparagine synthase (glutamine-hydrolysing)
MCGIYGTFNISIEQPLFLSQLNKMTHRGPDGFGIWQSPDQKVNLGHRRLAIIDTATRSNQPMHFDNRFVIVFNGEIYNYLEIKKELEKEGVHFETTSDTEVLLKLMITKGPQALNQLNGMWSFVLYDDIEKTFLICRDRIGKKPLYYLHEEERFAFSSEIKNLGLYLRRFEYNTEYIDYSVRHVTENENLEDTIVRGIKKFPPGSFGIFKNGQLIINRYYYPEKLLDGKPGYKSFNEAVEQFRQLFESSCSLRMRSDVPVGSALSGGIDSSFVVSTIARLGFAENGSYKALVSSFPGSFLDETDAATSIAKNAGVNIEPVVVQTDLNPDHILEAIYHFEEIAGTSPLPFFQLYQGFRNRNVVVTLDGHGGDELFGGYASDLYEKLKDDFPNILEMKHTLNSIDKTYGFSNEYTLKKTWPHFKKELLRKIRAKRMTNPFVRESFYKRQLFHSTFRGMLPTLLRNYDKYSMAAGVEVRMPFLDYRIIEFAFTLPNHYKLRDGYTKAIIRTAAQKIVPPAILRNKVKTGWNSPMGEWFAGPWKQWLLDETNSVDFRNCDLVNHKDITESINKFYSKAQDHGAGQSLWVKLQPYLIEKANRIYNNIDSVVK